MLSIIIQAANYSNLSTDRPERMVVPYGFGKLEIVFASVDPIPWADLAEYARVLLGSAELGLAGLWEVSSREPKYFSGDFCPMIGADVFCGRL